MNTIAASAGLPKANLHYYFTNKLGLYIAVLSNILELWAGTSRLMEVSVQIDRDDVCTDNPPSSLRQVLMQ